MIPPSTSSIRSLYLHVPFCRHRCAYCDFNTYAGQESMIPDYVDALCREIDFVGSHAPAKISLDTIFFGGGTPSLLETRHFERILVQVQRSFGLNDAAEVTIEVNPGTCTQVGLAELHSLGINRLSFGVQSANSEELRMLERAHTFFDVLQAFAWARKAGFDNLNMDLIYGLPGGSMKVWQVTLERALDLHPDHISAYALTLEHGTPFGRWSKCGLIPMPDADLAADMYEWAGEVLAASGFLQYEISNWSKPGSACRHNLTYWRGMPYLGLGAGAHGYAGGFRYSNVLRIKSYINRLSDAASSDLLFPLTPAVINHHRQSLQDDMSELMISGLRLTREGVADRDFNARFESGLWETYPDQITELLGLGLLEWARSDAPNTLLQNDLPNHSGDVLRLTVRGRLLGNQVFMRFL